MKYVDLSFKPNKDQYIIVTYYIESKKTLKELGEYIAAESSFGEFTKDNKISDKTFKKFAPRVFNLKKKQNLIQIAFPVILFEKDSITHVLSMIWGSLLTLSGITKVFVSDITFPKKYISTFKGPYHGVAGIRKILGNKKRPIMASSMKPKMGISISENVAIAKEMWLNGFDIIKDDERMTDVSYNKFVLRVSKILKAKQEIEKETNTKKLYIFNITGTPDKIFERADFIQKMGGKAVMVDVVATGIDNIHMLRKSNIGLIIHGHRAAYGGLTKDKKFGLSMSVMMKLARLAGADQLHVGVSSEYKSLRKKKSKELREILLNDMGIQALSEKFYTKKSVMPVIFMPHDDVLAHSVLEQIGHDVIMICE